MRTFISSERACLLTETEFVGLNDLAMRDPQTARFRPEDRQVALLRAPSHCQYSVHSNIYYCSWESSVGQLVMKLERYERRWMRCLRDRFLTQHVDNVDVLQSALQPIRRDDPFDATIHLRRRSIQVDNPFEAMIHSRRRSIRGDDPFDAQSSTIRFDNQ